MERQILIQKMQKYLTKLQEVEGGVKSRLYKQKIEYYYDLLVGGNRFFYINKWFPLLYNSQHNPTNLNNFNFMELYMLIADCKRFDKKFVLPNNLENVDKFLRELARKIVFIFYEINPIKKGGPFDNLNYKQNVLPHIKKEAPNILYNIFKKIHIYIMAMNHYINN